MRMFHALVNLEFCEQFRLVALGRLNRRFVNHLECVCLAVFARASGVDACESALSVEVDRQQAVQREQERE